MNLVELTFTTSATGAATVTSPYVRGRVVSVRVPTAGTAWAPAGGTADLTLTRVADGGTVLSLSNISPPIEYNPALPAHSVSGGTSAYATGVGPVYGGGVPVAGALSLSIAQGSASQPGTVYVYVC